MKNDFIKCGVTGCCMEVLWTSFCSVKNKNSKLTGHTSAFMFPIYGMASIIKPASEKLKGRNKDVLERGIIYTMGIYAMEYVTGMLLKKKDMCPWDYSESRYNIKGVIRLDYAPLWFMVGLMYENMLADANKEHRA